MTHLSRQWLFHTAFYGVADILFLVLGLLSVRVVSGTRWDVFTGAGSSPWSLRARSPSPTGPC